MKSISDNELRLRTDLYTLIEELKDEIRILEVLAKKSHDAGLIKREMESKAIAITLAQMITKLEDILYEKAKIREESK
jgi:hypothetical protein